MTVKTRAQINSEIATSLADNTSEEITPADIRTPLADLADSAKLAEDLATVATTGAYADLSGKPTLGSAAGLNSGTAAGNVPVLDGSGKIAAAVLPSYVDDVLEYANFAAFPGTGETGKIYIAADTNYQYRWSGSVYTQITASPGTTDAVPEGSTNLYFTAGRVRATVLTGLSLLSSAAVIATDTVLDGIGKLQKQITDLVTSVGGLRQTINATKTFYVGFSLGAATVSIASPGVVTRNAHGLVAGSRVAFAILANTKTATISVASPAVVTMANSFAAGQPIIFQSTGGLPKGITAGTTYYVIATGLSGASFQFSATVGGAAINTSNPTVTISNASPAVVTETGHGRSVGDAIQFATTGALPTGLSVATTYFVKTVVDANTYNVSATPEGTAINTSSAGSGTHTIVQFGTHYLSETGTLPTGITEGVEYYVIATGLTANTFQVSATNGGAAINTTGSTAGKIIIRTGSDSNDGLSYSASGALLTIQGAVDKAAALDLSIYDCVILVDSGVYDGFIPKSLVGAGKVFIRGKNLDLFSTVLAGVSGNVTVNGIDGWQGTYKVEYCTVRNATGTAFLVLRGTLLFGNINIGTCGSQHFSVNVGSFVRADEDYMISGGAPSGHVNAYDYGQVRVQTRTITIIGFPTVNFVSASRGGNILGNGNTYNGLLKGTRYGAGSNGIVLSGSGSATYFPGSIAGSTNLGGLYL
ncbi:hypothetical protein [Mesorhizobium sp.]|uniref:hypothetical protein n=1 Tax=Mesorhizobium sp. TaxID=1871066 RepID=UPI0025BFF771|nr:hypothetical protein [Mesorhizobium sp.]